VVAAVSKEAAPALAAAAANGSLVSVRLAYTDEGNVALTLAA
jgi:hypothetical protein